MSKWIAVSDSAPFPTPDVDYGEGCEVSRRVLVYSEYEGGILFGYRCHWYDTDDNNHEWSKDARGYQCIEVTHWMDLPDAPDHSN